MADKRVERLVVFPALFQVDLGSCVPNDAGWANVDMDSLGATNADGSTTGQSITNSLNPRHLDRMEGRGNSRS